MDHSLTAEDKFDKVIPTCILPLDRQQTPFIKLVVKKHTHADQLVRPGKVPFGQQFICTTPGKPKVGSWFKIMVIFGEGRKSRFPCKANSYERPVHRKGFL